MSKSASSIVRFNVKFWKGAYNLPDAASNFLACGKNAGVGAGNLLGSTTISIFETSASGINCRPYYDEITSHEFGHALGLGHSLCSDNIMYDAGGSDMVGLVPEPADCSAVDDFWLSSAEFSTTPPPPVCECSFPTDCGVLYGHPGSATWACLFCQCLLFNSPLVLHLPDYFSTSEPDRIWWEQGFCGPEVPTVCLDWLGDGNVTCTGWTAPDSEIAFVVALSDDDMLSLADGLHVPVEPWRHFFGNVTMGPDGGFPYAHGFEALADFCGLDPSSTSKIDFSEERTEPILWHGKTMTLVECGLSLQVWADRSGDGVIAPDEIFGFQDLGIESLSDVAKTDKRDRCGNMFPVESHATCYDLANRACGTWLDVFFAPRM
ncbi:MAG: hypothetical protein GY719_18705 [bacterium]|nr:hypothetical protein [bacterium]